jgi:subtilisin family serine protease
MSRVSWPPRCLPWRALAVLSGLATLPFALLVTAATLLVTAPVALAGDGLPTRLVVRFKAGPAGAPVDARGARATDRPLPAQAIAALSSAAGWPLDYVRPLPDGAHVLEVAMAAGAPSPGQLVAALRRLPSVERAEEDVAVTTQSQFPDPLELSRLWNLRAAARGSYGSGFVDAWTHATGRAGVVVAVIDTGVLPHPDLVGSGGTLAPSTGALVSQGYDFTSDCRIRASCPAGTASRSARVAPSAGALDLGDWISDADRAYTIFANCRRSASSWHGTHVAGVVGALADAQGMVGAAWGVRLLPVRVLGKCGGYMSDVAEAVRWAAGVHPSIPNPTPARVLNLSLGGGGGCSATMQSAVDAARAAGALVVAAAGNSKVDAATFSVAGCDGVVSVAASTHAGELASYSNYGTTHVALSAPGGDGRTWGAQVLSAMNTGATTHDPAGWVHAERTGTSFAAPHVAAAAALLLSRDARLSPTSLAAALVAPGAVTAFPTGSPCQVSGACGAGILDATRVLLSAASRLRPSVESVWFGNVDLDTDSQRSVRITNDNPYRIAIGRVVIAGAAGAAGFSIAGDDCSGREIGAQGTCTLTVAFAAGEAPRLAAATLALQAAGSESTLVALPLSAAVGSRLRAAPAQRQLAVLPTGQTASVQVDFANVSESDVRLQPLRIAGNGRASTLQDGCSYATLAPGQTCALSLTVGPAAAGDYAVQLLANTDGDGDVGFTVSIEGSSPLPAPLEELAVAAGGGGGGCTMLAGGGGAPDATLALLVLGLASWRRWRRSSPTAS